MVPVGQFYTFDCDKTADQGVGKKILRRIQNFFFKIKKPFPKYPPHFAVNHFWEMLDPPITFNTRQQLAIFFLEVRILRKTCILPVSWPIYL